MILTTMCYIQEDAKTLLLHRVKKENDINQGKWIGVGGKLEEGESIEECMIREIKEETGLNAKELVLHGYVSFPGLYYGEDEGMFIYTCDVFEGHLLEDCNEGYLKWVYNKDISTLPMWEGDYHFFEWIKDSHFHSAKIVYENDHIIEYKESVY